MQQHGMIVSELGIMYLCMAWRGRFIVHCLHCILGRGFLHREKKGA